MKKVVIIGGGFSGSTIARMLENKFDVTLIDTKPYFEFTPSILRTIVEPDHHRNIQACHSLYLKRAKVIIGHVTRFDETQVYIGKKKIKFDYLAICSGSRYNEPIKDEDAVLAHRAEVLRRHSSKLKNSKDVVIVGGGLVGIELAAEIATLTKDKNVTLIHSGNRLIERNSIKASRYAKNFLEKNRVSIILGKRAARKKGAFLMLDDKTKIKAEIIFMCTGITPNTGFIAKKYLDERGFVKVNPNLIVAENIFCAGDANDIKCEKTAQNAERQAKIVAKNICLMEKGRKLSSYCPSATPIITSLGKEKGIFEYKKIVLTGFLPAIMKGLVERKEMFKFRH